jgi:PIN domain nuclease of toxin-antitoxin system
MGERKMVNRYLLDTHAFLWAVSEYVQKLGEAALVAITDDDAEIYISAASIYELVYKEHKGKMDEFSGVVSDLASVIEQLGAKELPVNWQHASAAGSMDWSHRDPFDRILIAQAVTEDLTLISCDAAFSDAPEVRVLWES